MPQVFSSPITSKPLDHHPLNPPFSLFSSYHHLQLTAFHILLFLYIHFFTSISSLHLTQQSLASSQWLQNTPNTFQPSAKNHHLPQNSPKSTKTSVSSTPTNPPISTPKFPKLTLHRPFSTFLGILGPSRITSQLQLPPTTNQPTSCSFHLSFLLLCFVPSLYIFPTQQALLT